MSDKINNVKQLTKLVDENLTKKNNNLKIKSKIKKVGDSILSSTFKEINSFIK